MLQKGKEKRLSLVPALPFRLFNVRFASVLRTLQHEHDLSLSVLNNPCFLITNFFKLESKKYIALLDSSRKYLNTSVPSNFKTVSLNKKSFSVTFSAYLVKKFSRFSSFCHLSGVVDIRYIKSFRRFNLQS